MAQLFKYIYTSQIKLFAVYYILLGLSLFFLILFSFKGGVNGDDNYHVPQGESTYKWYASFGKDTSFLEKKTYEYGGLFELMCVTTNKILDFEPLDPQYHDVRHFYASLFGFLIIFAGSGISIYLLGWEAGILCLLFLFLTPKIVGHATFNPKDIPFAAGYISALYFLIKWSRQVRSPNYKIALGLILGCMIALNIRIGGLILLAYVGMFSIQAVLIDIMKKNRINNSRSSKKKSRKKRKRKPKKWSYWESNYNKYALSSLAIIVVAYFSGLLFWPYGLLDPINHPYEILTSWSDFQRVVITVIFDGDLISSNAIPWYYIPKYILITTPSVILIGLIFLLYFLSIKWKSVSNWSAYSILLFATIFPIYYVIYKDSSLYDGLRHLLFIVPPLIVLCSLGWSLLLKTVGRNFRLVLYVILALGLIQPLLHIFKNPQVAYTYFNMVSGGMSAASGHYELDYYGQSMRQAYDWLIEHEKLDQMDRDITVSTNFSYALRVYTSPHKNVNSQYTRFRQRYDKNWDYAIYIARFIDSGQLSSGHWPSSRAIKTIDIDGVPVAAIYKALNDKNVHVGQTAFKNGNHTSAKALFEKEVNIHPDNDISWYGLAKISENAKQYQEAIEYYQEVLRINPTNAQAISGIGLIQLNQSKIDEARLTFQSMLELNNASYLGLYYLGYTEMQLGRYPSALSYCQQSVEDRPNFKAGYQLMAQIYEAMGDKQRARNIRNSLKQ